MIQFWIYIFSSPFKGYLITKKKSLSLVHPLCLPCHWPAACSVHFCACVRFIPIQTIALLLLYFCAAHALHFTPVSLSFCFCIAFIAAVSFTCHVTGLCCCWSIENIYGYWRWSQNQILLSTILPLGMHIAYAEAASICIESFIAARLLCHALLCYGSGVSQSMQVAAPLVPRCKQRKMMTNETTNKLTRRRENCAGCSCCQIICGGVLICHRMAKLKLLYFFHIIIPNKLHDTFACPPTAGSRRVTDSHGIVCFSA